MCNCDMKKLSRAKNRKMTRNGSLKYFTKLEVYQFPSVPTSPIYFCNFGEKLTLVEIIATLIIFTLKDFIK